jgi:hypothetical protein
MHIYQELHITNVVFVDVCGDLGIERYRIIKNDCGVDGEYYEVIDERGIQDLFFGLLGLVVFPLVTVTALSLVVFIEN